MGGEQTARLQNTLKLKPVLVREPLRELLQVGKIGAQPHQIEYSVAKDLPHTLYICDLFEY